MHSSCQPAGTTRPEGGLLVGYSDSRQGDDALALAGVLARLLGCRPTILRVIPVAPYLLGEDPTRAAERESQPDLAVARELLADFDPSTRAACDPSVARALTDVAEEEGSAVIVVGSTHRGRVARLVSATTGGRLLQGGPAPVAVAPPGYSERKPDEIRRIGVGVDGSPESFTALVAAVGLAEAASAELHVLSVREPSPYGYGDTFEVLTAGDYESLATRRARQSLDDAAARVPIGVPLHKHLLHDDPGARLVEESRRLDLLVLGSRGYGPLRRTMLGSVSGQVLDHASCPLIVMPRGATALPFGARARLGDAVA